MPPNIPVDQSLGQQGMEFEASDHNPQMESGPAGAEGIDYLTGEPQPPPVEDPVITGKSLQSVAFGSSEDEPQEEDPPAEAPPPGEEQQEEEEAAPPEVDPDDEKLRRYMELDAQLTEKRRNLSQYEQDLQQYHALRQGLQENPLEALRNLGVSPSALVNAAAGSIMQEEQMTPEQRMESRLQQMEAQWQQREEAIRLREAQLQNELHTQRAERFLAMHQGDDFDLIKASGQQGLQYLSGEYARAGGGSMVDVAAQVQSHFKEKAFEWLKVLAKTQTFGHMINVNGQQGAPKRQRQPAPSPPRTAVTSDLATESAGGLNLDDMTDEENFAHAKAAALAAMRAELEEEGG